jgi:hypothetical protein
MQCDGKAEFEEAFLMLVGKVANAKLSGDEKQAKVAQLRSANTTAFSRMGIQASTEIYRKITEILPPEEVAADLESSWTRKQNRQQSGWRNSTKRYRNPVRRNPSHAQAWPDHTV